MMASCERLFPSTRSIASFFSTHEETVNSETEEKKRKDDDSDEDTTDRSQKPNSSRYEKKFNPWWLYDYSRLKHDSEN